MRLPRTRRGAAANANDARRCDRMLPRVQGTPRAFDAA
ncbi:hypothetical protein BURMUCF1_A0991 [Burkholderia multivorans ATCC BAA-247]|nr:hypothetical protein BURMUCF1_A0991 [Burkholderia multivorans ATCC BAA-247]